MQQECTTTELVDEIDRLRKEGEEERAALVHILLDVEDWKEGRKLAAETIRMIEHRVRKVTELRSSHDLPRKS